MNKLLKYGILVSLSLIVAATVAFAFSIPGMSKFEKVKPVNGAVTIPVADVSDGKAHYFRLADGGKEIDFFIVKGSDGALHTAFDACDVCYKEKKGYEQQGDKMICKNCNMKFAVNRIGASAAGGCNPSYLPARVSATAVSVSVADIKAGSRFF